MYIEFLFQLPIPTSAIIEIESINSDKNTCFGPSGPKDGATAHQLTSAIGLYKLTKLTLEIYI